MSRATDRALVELPAPQDRAGLVLSGTYRVLGRIGTGSMADVYEVEHVRLGTRGAAKFLRAAALSQARSLERFQREVRALAKLDDEHVVGVLDCGDLPDGTPYVVMERLFGEDLREQLRRSGRLAPARAVRIAIDACRGLSAVHAAGLIHRDVKPANLFLTRRSNRPECCKILDFGVAKLTSSEATHAGVLLGTLRYMAPEQLVDSAAVDARTDVYALGAVLYEALSGRPPHVAADVQELMFDILNRDIVPLGEQVDDLPEGLGAVVARAVDRDPARRFPSAKAFEAALSAFSNLGGALPDEGTLPDTSFGDIPRPPLRRTARDLLALLLATVGGVVIGLAASVGWHTRESTPRPASPERAEVAKPSTRLNVAQASVPSPSSAAPIAVAPQGVSSNAAARPLLQSRRRAAPNSIPVGSSSVPAAPPRENVAGIFDSENPYAR